MKKISRKAKYSIGFSIFILIVAGVGFYFAFNYIDQMNKSHDAIITNEYSAKIYDLETEKKELEEKILELEGSQPVDLPITTILVNGNNSEEIINQLNENSITYLEIVDCDYLFDDDGGNEYLLFVDEDINKVNELITFHNISGLFVPNYLALGLDTSLVSISYIYETSISDYIDINSKIHINYIESNHTESMSLYSSAIENKQNICIYINESGDSLANCLQMINYYLESKMTKISNSRFNENDNNSTYIKKLNEYRTRIDEINKEIEELQK